MGRIESVENYNHHVFLGEKAMDGKEYARALQEFTKAGTFRQHTLIASAKIAFVLHRLGRNDEARRDFERFYKIYYTNAYLTGKYAEFAFNIQEWDLALSLYEKFLKLKPDSAPCYLAIGKIRMRQGAYRTAIENFETVKRLTPDTKDARAGIGAAKLLLGNLEEAIRELRELLELSVNHQRGAILLSMCLQKKSVQERTLTYWGESLQLLLNCRFAQPVDTLRAEAYRQCLLVPLKVALGVHE